MNDRGWPLAFAVAAAAAIAGALALGAVAERVAFLGLIGVGVLLAALAARQVATGRTPKPDTELALSRRLLREARPYWPHIFGVFLISLLATPLALLTPVPLKIAVDELAGADAVPGFLDALLPATVTRSDPGPIVIAVGLLVGVALLRQVQQLAGSLLRTYTGERLVLGFRSRLFAHVQRLSLGYHDREGSTDSTYRIQYDASAVQAIALDGLIPLVTSLVTLVGMVAVTAAIDLRLALIAMAVSPVLLGVTHVYRRRLRRRYREVKKLESAAMSVIQEVLGALRVVKAFGQEEREHERFTTRSSQGMRARLGVAVADGAFGLLVGMTIAAGMGAVLYVGYLDVRAGVLTQGELILIMGYLTQLYEPLRTLSKRAATIQSAFASAERAFALLDEEPDVEEAPDARPLRRARGAVEFRDVTFAYGDGDPVLERVSFAVEPGARVGISGATGAGKSTLVSLLSRFYDPTAGQILLDGVDVREYRLADLRDQFAVVLQETVLFSTTVAENVAYARPDATFEEIVEAARAANVHEFVMSLPDGYDTLVGERGMRLSGGERQRIALARAFLKDAPILVLDEPTSSVDVDTERLIMEAMDRLATGRTTFMIAHRLGTLASCDVHLRVDRARVVPAPAPAPPRPRSAGGHRSPFEDHPAVAAWNRAALGREPLRVETLKQKSKTAVYRLYGAGEDGASVIAKRSRTGPAAVERTVYEEVLPALPVPSLAYYGSIGGEEPYVWLFLEDAGERPYSRLDADHRRLAAGWLGRLHAAAASISPTAELPDRGPQAYLADLRFVRRSVNNALSGAAVLAAEPSLLEHVLHQADALEERWDELVDFLAPMPQTLVHADFVEKNARLRMRDGRLELVAFDWTESGLGPPAPDLAHLLDPRDDTYLQAYRAATRECWPLFDVEDLDRVAEVGLLFRYVATMSWACWSLGSPWHQTAYRSIRSASAAIDALVRSPAWL